MHFAVVLVNIGLTSSKFKFTNMILQAKLGSLNSIYCWIIEIECCILSDVSTETELQEGQFWFI